MTKGEACDSMRYITIEDATGHAIRFEDFKMVCYIRSNYLSMVMAVRYLIT